MVYLYILHLHIKEVHPFSNVNFVPLVFVHLRVPHYAVNINKYIYILIIYIKKVLYITGPQVTQRLFPTVRGYRVMTPFDGISFLTGGY